MEKTIRLFDFNVFSENSVASETSSEEDGAKSSCVDSNKFLIQMFGMDEQGKTCCVIVEEFKPFFYVKVDDFWTIELKTSFLQHIQKKIGKYYEKSICECKLIKRKKLYGFDGGKEHKFILFKFNNIQSFNKVKNLWYDEERKLMVHGMRYYNTNIILYEANIPPLLRFFHIQNISPSGWVSLPSRTRENKYSKKTNCDFEYMLPFHHIKPINEKETSVPLKICSFDIEASSSHGDFPVPVKSYKKLATNIIEYMEKERFDGNPQECKDLLSQIIMCAFGYKSSLSSVKGRNDLSHYIDLVYPKNHPSYETVIGLIQKWFTSPVHNKKDDLVNQMSIESMFEKMNHDDEDEGETSGATFLKKYSSNGTVIDMLCDKKIDRNTKSLELNISLNTYFPRLKGDEVTFIGSTFLRLGDKDPYLNHCGVVNTCANVANTEIESFACEKDLLLGWRDIIQKENPDIVIGYNIFGFDYEFMFRRAEETDCVEEFLQLSKNKGEVCGTRDPKTNRYKIEETSIHIASGQHDLKYIKMTGRIQIDLYNFFRREENLTSYKLDFVAGHFIGDYIKTQKYEEKTDITTVITTNMTGLFAGSYIHLEEIGHSIDYYKDGAKFVVLDIDKDVGYFQIRGKIEPDTTKKVRWCLAKDDVTPQDIFRMTNGTAEDRAIIAKYCIQDCNLVHYLMNKVDTWTGFSEMAKICSVPINFLVLRGQGIKLTSYVAKKCREKGVLMPVMEKSEDQDGYEGAIVLDPKCDLYLDNPVACVDYASLYPSSMMSENISHDSKVWTKEYDLQGVLVEETGEKKKGLGLGTDEFIYDNLPGYQYVNITYDTFKYVRKTPSAAAIKVKCGYKICRFAQPVEGVRAIMPSILEELLLARKTTRKLIPQEKDEFIKNVLDKRQLGYKVTANSLYGQCGAKTSSFYEKDCAAATTATGRLLLTYAKKVVEECYGNAICETEKYGPVLTKAEYIYGDTDSVFFTFNLATPEGEPIRGAKALEITIELAQQAGHLASTFLKAPHDLEYEKTFMPFCLLSKKRYVGMLYETDPTKCKRKEMGIVLKRRDNAPIVKEIYGGIIDILMKQQDIQKASEFLRSSLRNIVNEAYPIDKLIISKSLRSGYKNPQQISHKVLADRITQRDPGNKPSSGDRIPYVYIHNNNKKALQGERIETPTFIKEKNLKIDYSFYITNQIMKPVQQVFALVLEKMWEMQGKRSKINKFKREVELLRQSADPEKFADKLENLKNKEVKSLLFDEFLIETNNQRENNQSIAGFFGSKKV